MQTLKRVTPVLLAGCLLAQIGKAVAQSNRVVKNVPASSIPPQAFRLVYDTAQTLGLQISTPPREIDKLAPSNYTGHDAYRIWWFGRGSIVVDTTSNTLVSLEWQDDDLAKHDPDDQTISRERAVSDVRAISDRFHVDCRNWIVDDASLYTPGEGYRNWTVRLIPLHAGWPAPEDQILATVNAYTGKISDWTCRLGCNSYAGPQKPRLSSARAQSLARAALDKLAPGEGYSARTSTVRNIYKGPAWSALSLQAPFARLAYDFAFDIPAKPNDLGPAGFEVVVDAETGEIWRDQLMIGGVDTRLAAPETIISPRMNLLHSLLTVEVIRDHGTTLAGAIAQGTPIDVARLAASPTPQFVPENGEGYSRFSVKIGSAEVSFALNAADRQLFWKMPNGHWAGVTVSAPAVSSVLNDLKAKWRT